MKYVRIIPAIPKENKKLRVAAYCRVSTSGPEQKRSLEIQIKTYTVMIRSHPDWIFIDVFYDVESGLRRSGRTGLDKMLRKAAKGKIDYIITKSISRVSRDTLEVLKIIRFLRKRGINMHFENEKLDSINADKEFEITLRGMLAQDESRNTSENIQWGFQRKFEKGDIFTKYKNFMGYDCVDGEIVIVPEQAEVVRKIFDLYLQGLSFGQIKSFLESQGIKTATGKEAWDAKTIQRMLTNDEYSGAALAKLGPEHLKDPFLEFKFDKKTFTGYTPSGGSIKVELSGYMGIDKIQVDGEYTGNSGYEFFLRTGEEIFLKAVVTANINEEIRIPIVGIDIDAKVARVTGGLFLVVGLNGQFTLSAETRQWLMINKAGIHGGTFFYVPTSFKYLFELGDSGMDGDASFNGAINGYIKAGPLLELELFGFDAAGAGALFGGGASCVVQDGYIDADVYGTVNIYAKLMDHKLNLANWKPTLFHKRQVDTEGYIFSFKEADAYRKTVWGRIEYDHGYNGGILPYANSSFQLKVTDADGKVKLTTTDALLTDASGNFVLKGIDLMMGDRIHIIVPSKLTKGKLIQSAYINPTFPFDKVFIEEADYFNDFIKGYIPTTRVKNWETGKFEDLNYTGDVTVILNNGGSSISSYKVKTDKYGQFIVENKPAQPFKLNIGTKINVLPESNISANIVFGGFPSHSNTDIKPSVNFVGQRLPVATGRSSYDEGDRRVELLSENETFIAYNLNGTKILSGDGIYDSQYKLYPMDNIINPDTGYPVFPPAVVGTRQAAIKLFPFLSSKEDDAGASFVINNFNTRWAWASFPTTTVEGPRSATGAPGAPVTVKVAPPLPDFSSLQPFTSKPSSSVANADQSQNTIDFRYDSWYKYPSSQDNIGEASNFIMVGAMRRYGEVQVPYEGATITIKAPSDADGNPRGEKTQYKDVNGLSMDRYLSRMFWATVSPTPEQDQLTEKISNFNALPGWSAAAAGNMVSKGFMDLGENRKFKSGNVSRAECAAYLTKAFGITSQPGRGKFTDIAPMNPYLPEINAAVSAGLISGYNANTFGPNDKVTREQMASIVMRGLRMKYGSTLSIPASTRQFADADKISSSTRTVTMEISALSIMNGDPNGTFKPKGFVTFNEMAVIINNLDGYVMKH